MSVMLGNNAVELIVGYLKGNCIACSKIPVYFYEKEVGQKNEYIVVNHLPFVHRGEVEEGIVNINVHSKKIKGDMPPAKRLASICSSIVALFKPRGIYLDKAYFEFYADSRPTPDSDGTYYVNLQVRVIYNDLNY